MKKFILLICGVICIESSLGYSQTESGIESHILTAMPRSERWGREWKCDDCLQRDGDILTGTFDEIKNVLKERGERKAGYISGHTEAFELGMLLLVLSWTGNPSGNVYDVRARVYKRDFVLYGNWCGNENLLSSMLYVKVIDRTICFVNSCGVYYDANGVWLRLGYVNGVYSMFRLVDVSDWMFRMSGDFETSIKSGVESQWGLTPWGLTPLVRSKTSDCAVVQE